MYAYVLIASQCQQPPRPSSGQAYYEEFGTVPFSGIRKAIRAVGGMLRRIGVPRVGPFRRRRAASVL